MPDSSKISLSVSENILSNRLTGIILDVKVTSENEDPIECFYNSDLSKDITKKFSILGLLSIKNVVLYPNKEDAITLYIKGSDLVNGEKYPLYTNEVGRKVSDGML